MLNNVLILFILSLSSYSYTYAGTVTDKNPRFPLIDTADILIDTADINKDSIKSATGLAVNDQKENIEELMITANTGYQINKEHLNPAAIGFVEDYIDKFGATLDGIKADSKVYLNMMDEVLSKHGLPKELKYIAVIESYLNPNARSGAGAVGAWQFMPGTARNMGLKVTHKIDERRNVYKSTHAACRYLTSLYSLYGNWLLVIAAYNSGPGYVNTAIKKSGSDDFWELQQYLPEQSRNHVKKFIATHYFMEGCASITTLTKKEAANFLLTPDASASTADDNLKAQSISGRYNSSVIAKYVAIDLKVFSKYNPNFDKLIADNGKYELHLPAGMMDIFIEKKNEILSESVQLLLNPENISTATGSLTSPNL